MKNTTRIIVTVRHDLSGLYLTQIAREASDEAARRAGELYRFAWDEVVGIR